MINNNENRTAMIDTMSLYGAGSPGAVFVGGAGVVHVFPAHAAGDRSPAVGT